MAQNSGNPKFPTPIPNPLAQKSQASSAPIYQEEEKTDPAIVVEEKTPAPRQATPTPVAIQPDKKQDTLSPLPPPTPQLPPARMPEMGPLDSLMKDPTITEIMVNDLRNVMIERNGVLQFSGFTYQTIDELNRLTRNILDITGRILSPDSPYVDTMLPDGSRVNIVAPPLTLIGPCLTIRKFPSKRPTINDLITNGTLDQRIAYFLNVCVLGKMNILVSGGTGSGKTTLLNVLAAFIPKGERIVTIEDTPELAIQHFNSVKLQTKPQTPGSSAILARELVANALRMRPDRIIIGECRRSEAFDMLQAMNTGHSGSMSTLHANSPRDALARLETLCMLTGIDFPLLALKKQISSAIDLIVQIKRFRNGKRRVIAISEVTGMEGETITLQDIFIYETDLDTAGQSAETGKFKVTGMVPSFVERLREQGIEFPRSFFG
jgi:pilus assembly protein CpaF